MSFFDSRTSSIPNVIYNPEGQIEGAKDGKLVPYFFRVMLMRNL